MRDYAYATSFGSFVSPFLVLGFGLVRTALTGGAKVCNVTHTMHLPAAMTEAFGINGLGFGRRSILGDYVVIGVKRVVVA